MIDYERLNQIEERLKAFRAATHSQEDDPEPGWKASDDFHFNSPSDIEWLIAMLNKHLSLNERLRDENKHLLKEYQEVLKAYREGGVYEG